MTEVGVGAAGDLSGERQSSAGQAREKAEQAAEQAREKAEPALRQARGRAEELRGQAGNRVRGQVDTRSTDAGEQVQALAGAVRTSSEDLRGQGREREAKVAEQAAERAERAGAYLRDSDADRILGDVEAFARERPWLVVVTGAALGFLAARFLKASAPGTNDGAGRAPVEDALRRPTWEEREAVLDAPVAPATAPAVDLAAPPPEPPQTDVPGYRLEP